jgi:hypothetical protein
VSQGTAGGNVLGLIICERKRGKLSEVQKGEWGKDLTVCTFVDYIAP